MYTSRDMTVFSFFSSIHCFGSSGSTYIDPKNSKQAGIVTVRFERIAEKFKFQNRFPLINFKPLQLQDVGMLGAGFCFKNYIDMSNLTLILILIIPLTVFRTQYLRNIENSSLLWVIDTEGNTPKSKHYRNK